VFALLIVGLIAEGGGDLSVVFESENDLTLLLVFDSVVIVCAIPVFKNKNRNAIRIFFVFITIPLS
jgi:hypothetical protein